MNYIIIKNITETNVEMVVSELADRYYDSGFVNSVIINKIAANHYLLEFPDQPDFERFMYFVNYLTYPEVKLNDKPHVYGVWNEVKPNQNLESEQGEKLLIYVSQFDTAYDNVTLENAKGKRFTYSFTGKLSGENRHELNYHELIVLPQQYTPIISILPSQELKKHEVKPWWKFW